MISGCKVLIFPVSSSSPHPLMLAAPEQDTQTSADTKDDRGVPHGAMTNGLLATLAQYNYNVTYLNLVNGVRSDIKRKGYQQEPCLECAPDDVNCAFLAPRSAGASPQKPVEPHLTAQLAVAPANLLGQVQQQTIAQVSSSPFLLQYGRLAVKCH